LWRAELEGDPETLEILRKNFKSYIIFDNEKYFLKCFQLETVDQTELHALIPFIEEKFQQMLLILYLYHKPLDAHLTGIFENMYNGRRLHTMSTTISGNSSMRANMVVLINGEIVERTGPDPQVVQQDLEKSLKCIMHNQNIGRALNFNKNPTWVNLYKVYELIRHDMGGKSEIVNKRWATANEIDLFTCTAHNVQGAGLDARHAVESKINDHCRQILSNHDPMKLSNAKSLIGGLLKDWIEYKCN
jgi:hypothetical protein